MAEIRAELSKYPIKTRLSLSGPMVVARDIAHAKLKERLDVYEKLTRLDRPIGILLLLWPTLWGLWLSSNGSPNPFVAVIFVLGVVLMLFCLAAWAMDAIGIHAVFGGFLLGTAMPRGFFARELQQKLEPVAVVLLLPFASLAYAVAAVELPRRVRGLVLAVLLLSPVLMVAPGLLGGRGADLALVYGTHTVAFVLQAVAVCAVLACRSDRLGGACGLCGSGGEPIPG